MTIELRGFLIAHQQLHGTFNYMVITNMLTTVAERVAFELSLPVLTN